MDAAEDKDIALQRASADLLSELLFSVPRFLCKSYGQNPQPQLRRTISYPAVTHLIRLLEPFQEWPQLLDTHLDALVPPIAEAYLQALPSLRDVLDGIERAKSRKIPLTKAICMVLYSFCKIRGPKVICRFMNNEPRHIDALLSNLERQSLPPAGIRSRTSLASPTYSWEEKYITLLWLSHLLLAPFDLDTIASSAASVAGLNRDSRMKQMLLPPNLPDVALRLVRVAMDNLHSAGKEHEAAIAMLVRLATRPDMQRLRLHDALIRWNIQQVQGFSKGGGISVSDHTSIGALSFLAALVKLADTATVAPFILYIFKSVRKSGVLHSKNSSALSRKAVVKIYIAISVASLQLDQSKEHSSMNLSEHVIEDVIGDLLAALADNDTPVRQAASKALSVITLNLDASMAAEVSEAVTGGLSENVLWETVPELLSDGSHSPQGTNVKQRNLTAVDPLRWQGLVLTLSHLLFRRSPPISQLPTILDCLILALSFEQRSSLGASIGANVRDAACFGIWALARRYSTEELLALEPTSLSRVSSAPVGASILQILAIELIAAATADPTGNIRRGASAALQELIGRHPDTVLEGISLVQIVDYHAVASTERALIHVAVRVAKLSHMYWQSVLAVLMTWRGIGAVDIESRRLAANTVGSLSVMNCLDRVPEVTKELWQSMNALDASTVTKRQGFMLAMAAVVKALRQSSRPSPSSSQAIQRQWDIFSEGLFLSEKDFTSATLKPDLTAEGVCCLVDELAQASYGNGAPLKEPSMDVMAACLSYIRLALDRKEAVVCDRAALAARSLTEILPTELRESWIRDRLASCEAQREVNLSTGPGHLFALGVAFSSRQTQTSDRGRILGVILSVMKTAANIDTRIAATKSLRMLLSNNGNDLDAEVFPAVHTAMQDYTIDQRGDIGSVLRLEAIHVVSEMGSKSSFGSLGGEQLLLETLSTLAGERLDKVRCQAWNCLSYIWNPTEPMTESPLSGDWVLPALRDSQQERLKAEPITPDQAASPNYFAKLLSLFRFKALRAHLLRGLVTSLSGGSESVLVAARNALGKFIDTLEVDQLQAFCSCFEDFLRNQLSVERLIIPTLESLAFLLDLDRFRKTEAHAFRWRNLLALVQKAHYKTTSISKLQAALDVYVGLAQVQAIRGEVLKKLCALLSHPIPKIRNATAETLYIVTQNKFLVPVDWTKSPGYIRSVIDHDIRPSLM